MLLLVSRLYYCYVLAVEADGPCKKTVENLGKHKPGEITSSESVREDTTADVASQSFCLGKNTDENQEEDHDPTKEISHVSPSDSTLNLSCEEFASSNSPGRVRGQSQSLYKFYLPHIG